MSSLLISPDQSAFRDRRGTRPAAAGAASPRPTGAATEAAASPDRRGARPAAAGAAASSADRRSGGARGLVPRRRVHETNNYD